MIKLKNLKLGIVGMGYVGLPLAVEFSKKYQTVGFDINQKRIKELQSGNDATLEVSETELNQASSLTYTYDVNDFQHCNVFIITVPTPIDKHNQPDLTPLIKASEMLATIIKKDDVVIYESTVYPGATEEVCIPTIERNSVMVFNKDFYAGYSPERINPGDKSRRVTNILKVTSGSTPEIADFVDELYKSIITAGTHKATSIKVAEASKVIENVQRDVNIALVNELHQIFNRLGINTNEVIEAAATKWNFMKLFPGLVGGHCIGVDPYYLLHKSQTHGYVPDLMRQAREINDTMPSYIADDFLKSLMKSKINPINCKVALLGFSFKENCPDFRNTKILDLYNALVSLDFEVTIYDPWVNTEEVFKEYGVKVESSLPKTLDVVLLGVGHTQFIDYAKNLKSNGSYVYDFKGLIG
jgi:UDP-N-acetyl-D-galactosamine dehydrogenase